MTPGQDSLREQVRRRANDRCEYCRMHQSLQGSTFHVEHVMPRSKAGPTVLENLAWACPGCNFHKSNRIAVPDPVGGAETALFNPRIAVWSEHFRWDGYRLDGLTATGRATIAALELNSDRRLLIRQAEEMLHLFPP